MMKIRIINGPNLNLLGSREVGIYGDVSFQNYLEKLKKRYPAIVFDYFQSNIEGEIINSIQNSDELDGIILNAGGYTHTSVAIGDAINAIEVPVVEVHISNIMAREEFRSRSMISSGVKGIIIGFGLESYHLAVQALSDQPV